MNDLKIFENEQFGQIRTSVTESGEPLFCLADLCNSIVIKNHRNVISRLDEWDVHRMDTPTKNQCGSTVIHKIAIVRSMILALNENFSSASLGTFKISTYFCSVLHSLRAVTSRKHNPLAVFLCAFGKAYRHRTPVEICNGNPALDGEVQREGRCRFSIAHNYSLIF